MNEDPAQTVRALLHSDGLHAALRFLNSRTPHRYTGIFLFDPPVLRNHTLADSWNAEPEPMAAAPLEATFCGYVGSTGSSFRSDDTHHDQRLTTAVLRENAVRSYCGVLLSDAAGEPFGTLCHFDTKPCGAASQELELLSSLAPLIVPEVSRQACQAE